MIYNCSFGVLGGDMRQIYLARSLASDGRPVIVSCLEKGDTSGLDVYDPKVLTAECGVIILPLPATRDGKRLSTPLSETEMILDDSFAEPFRGKTVFGGMTSRLAASSEKWKETSLFDYYEREELVTGNAFLTAEGAVGAAIHEYSGSLCGSKCLVTGYGRIGKALCPMLRSLGAEVSCCARRAEHFAAIRAIGCTPLKYQGIGGFDMIFNTVPSQVLGAPQLSKQGKDAVIFELASAPGGIDREAAARLGLRVVDLPSLPGKMSPKTSGELIKETVYNMLDEM